MRLPIKLFNDLNDSDIFGLQEIKANASVTNVEMHDVLV